MCPKLIRSTSVLFGRDQAGAARRLIPLFDRVLVERLVPETVGYLVDLNRYGLL